MPGSNNIDKDELLNLLIENFSHSKLNIFFRCEIE